MRYSFVDILKVTVLSVCLISVCGLLFISCVSVGGFSHKPFDSNAWKACSNSKNGGEGRQSMLDDLQFHYQLVGMSEAEFLKLLGKDDGYVKTKYSEDAPGFWQHTYCLGSPSMNPMDLGVKVLLFHVKNDKVSDYTIKTYAD